MIIFPAIDLKNGECVRLKKGDMNTSERVAESAVQTARSFAASGAQWMHMVDLDGAVRGERVNHATIVDAVRECGLNTEVGGGIRTMDDMEYYLANGISRVILGSVALKNSALVHEAVREFGGERVAVGIDARDGMVAAEGWVEDSKVDYIELAKRMEDAGVRYLIYTDISRDGMMAGADLEGLQRLNEAVSCHVTASGGVRSMADIQALSALGLYAAICGKSIYTGSLDLAEAVQYCKGV
ncbi:MAG: 1-(5-phosphoribosyl)-5-[(5-phosphoribosylamino)methylideneamino]imidazole-4-carboxamide isomerase [Clostridia bacterium]